MEFNFILFIVFFFISFVGYAFDFLPFLVVKAAANWMTTKFFGTWLRPKYQLSKKINTVSNHITFVMMTLALCALLTSFVFTLDPISGAGIAYVFGKLILLLALHQLLQLGVTGVHFLVAKFRGKQVVLDQKKILGWFFVIYAVIGVGSLVSSYVWSVNQLFFVGLTFTVLSLFPGKTYWKFDELVQKKK